MNSNLENQILHQSNRIAAVDPQLLAIFTAHVGLTKFLAEVEARALVEILWQSSQGITPPADATASAIKYHSFFQQSAKDVSRLASVMAGIAAVEATPGFAEAVKLIAPMVAERTRLTDQLAAETLAYQVAHGAADEAHAAARAKALAQAENDPAVVAARKVLAKFEDPDEPLVRGRQKLAIEALD